MRSVSIKKMVFAAMMAALTCIATMVIQIPSPANGYTNLGDCMVLLCGWILGPVYGSLAAGIGSALADLLSGYAHYVPGTFLIKGIMALAAFGAYRALYKLRVPGVFSGIFSGLVAELWMIAGYLGYAWLLLGSGLTAALASIPGNAVQGALGLVTAVLMFTVCKSNKTLRKLTAV